MSRLNRNGNGRIDSREVLTAIAAYNDVLEIGNESVSERDLLEVIAAFNSKRATVEPHASDGSSRTRLTRRQTLLPDRSGCGQ